MVLIIAWLYSCDAQSKKLVLLSASLEQEVDEVRDLHRLG